MTEAKSKSKGMTNTTERIGVLRERLAELTAEEADIERRLVTVREQKEATKERLLSEARIEMRLRVMPQEAARDTVARLGTFTMSELCAELGWERKQAKQLLDVMLCEVPPKLTLGKLGRTPLYEWVGPPPADPDPEETARRVAQERVAEFVATRDDLFTPAQAAHAADVPRADAIEALDVLVQDGTIVNEGPSPDMPLYRRADAPVQAPVVARASNGNGNGVSANAPKMHPEVTQLLDSLIADGVPIERQATGGFVGVSAPNGERVLIATRPRDKRALLDDRARLRKAGLNV